MVACGILWAMLGFGWELPNWIGRLVRRWGGKQLAHAGGDLWARYHSTDHPDRLLAEVTETHQVNEMLLEALDLIESSTEPVHTGGPPVRVHDWLSQRGYSERQIDEQRTIGRKWHQVVAQCARLGAQRVARIQVARKPDAKGR